MPETFDISPYSGELPAALCAVIARGGLIAFPTETFYGLGVRSDDGSGLEALARVKGRASTSPFPLVAESLGAVERLCEIPTRLSLLARSFWPGPLTLAVRPRRPLHPLLTAPDGTIGIRVSSLPLARSLAGAAGGVITATSANLVGEPPARSPQELPAALRARLDAVVDGGRTAGGAPSSICGVDDEGELRIVRVGALSEARLLGAWEATT